MSDALPPNITVDINNPELIKFSDSLSKVSKPQSIKLIDNPRPIGNCYWNAWAQQKEKGGKVVYGWIFNEWPGYFIIAMHHAVWQADNGELYDVSAKYDSDTTRHSSTFLQDDTLDIDLQKLPKVCSRFHVYSHVSPEIKSIIDLIINSYQMKNLFETIQSSTIYSLGYRCENQFKIAEGIDAGPVGITINDKELLLTFNFSSEMEGIYSSAFTSSLNYLKNTIALIK